MANNEYPNVSNYNRVFTYSKGRKYDKYLQSKPTIKNHTWRDVKTGGLVVFNHF
jgi:hypothetical protein